MFAGTEGAELDQSQRLFGSLSEEGRYGLLLNAVTDYAIYMLDAAGTVASWNAGAERFKGYLPAEIIGQHFSRFYAAEDQARGEPVRALETARREGKFEAEGWRIRKDGTRFWAHVVIDPIVTPAGELIGFAKITRDLTERRAAERLLRRSEEQFRLLVQGVTDYAIYMLEPDGTISSWNAGAERIKGYRPEEIIGQHFSRFYTAEDIGTGEPNKALRIALEEGRFEKEGWRLRKDGSRFRANVVIDPIRDDQGTLIGFAKVTRDVTERDRAHHALDKAREALMQSQKMDAIGQLTGGIAHDFNNLLTAIIGSLELAQKRLPPDSRVAPLLDNALQGARRGSTLTQRMLAFARRQELQMTPTDILALVRGMGDLLQRSLGPTITIETRFPLKLVRALSDVNQLEAALLNLAVNARDSMPEGGQIVIAAREEVVGSGHPTGLPPGLYVALSVTDSGEGMDSDTLARATEPFFTTKGIGKGTGLGLSSVQGLTEQSGGRFVLKSLPGVGTTAEIWMPASEAPAEEAVREPQPLPVQGPVRRLAVLVVDDDSLVLMNTAALLDDLGHTVFEAVSGKQALEILAKEKRIDVVITDQAMPQMTGTQLATRIRETHPDLPIILATGYAELPPGTDMTMPKLAKPFYQDDLARILAQALTIHEPKGKVVEFRAR